ncbi:hypothetical protein [Hyphomonas sp. BRH_c22]|nr:hypothetical protein [Hyphomonas sp. BRH_c22]
MFADLKARFAAWTETMLPYDAESFSHGFTSNELADHFSPTPSK